MTRDELLGDAWLVLQFEARHREMDPALKWFWLELLQEIHHAGDGTVLCFGPRNHYRGRAGLAHRLNVSEADLDRRIKALVKKDLLRRVGDDGFGIPRDMSRLCGAPPQVPERKPFQPKVVAGGRS